MVSRGRRGQEGALGGGGVALHGLYEDISLKGGDEGFEVEI
tara:strand:+ start:58 stop:180 length:123 start_codon:yes stop_codon:yes gene_type:complete